MTDQPPTGADDEPATAAAGGTWLTYRYRLGGEGIGDATGTMKAPSFLAAARRILARGLGTRLGAAPAYLRLRAAGEEEMLFRIRPAGPPVAEPQRHLEVVPGGTYTFADGADPAVTSPRS